MVIPRTYGRMGNFLFQVACAAAYAWRNGLEFTVPTTTNDPKWNPIYLQHLAQLGYKPDKEQVVIKEKAFTYQPLPFDPSWRDKNIVLDGYWQTERYFSEYRGNILEAFDFPWESEHGYVSIHVRRGDYLTIQKNGVFKHPPVPKEWIETQMKRFRNYRFRFYSDDIAWCQEHFGNRSDCSFSIGQCEEDDLVEMSHCQHHICSASTFSWWGAWLNRDPKKLVIMPKHWLSPGWGGLDMSDVVPPNWERA